MAGSQEGCTVTEWVVSESIPRIGNVEKPLGYTAFRLVVACPLRFAFSVDMRFPQKTSPQARIGTAFHDTLAFITTEKNTTLEAAIDHFGDALRQQRDKAVANYRERRLPWPKKLIEVMENTIALRMSERPTSVRTGRRQYVESTLLSPDGLLIGRPDHIILSGTNPIIVDYKSGSLDPDALHSYEDQIHFYAGLWNEIHGTVVKTGRIEFLLENYTHEFTIDPSRSRLLMSEARVISSRLREGVLLFQSKISEHCGLCEYRPWCTDYWSARDRFDVASAADIEGDICALHSHDTQSLCVKNRDRHLLVINKDTSPFPAWPSGARVRIVDLYLGDTVGYRTAYSEIYRVSSEGDDAANRASSR